LQAGSTAQLTCCDLHGNAGGDWVGALAPQLGTNGNICLDPLFCDAPAGDLRLQPSSPCAPYTPPNPECDLLGAQPVGCSSGLPLVEPPQDGMVVRRVTPNPCRDRLHIECATSGAAGGEVTVRDPLGRCLRRWTLSGAGTHQLYWDGRDAGGRRVPGGVYFLCPRPRAPGGDRRVLLIR
jgi:hypothetical protein